MKLFLFAVLHLFTLFGPGLLAVAALTRCGAPWWAYLVGGFLVFEWGGLHRRYLEPDLAALCRVPYPFKKPGEPQ